MSYKVRTIEKDGQTWFFAKDVCNILQIKNITKTLQKLNDDDLTSQSLKSDKVIKLISFSGLYTLVFRSNTPESRTFARWIRKEILPQIMHTGGRKLR